MNSRNSISKSSHDPEPSRRNRKSPPPSRGRVRVGGQSTLDSDQTSRPPSRRQFLQQSAFGIGSFALAHLMARDGLLARDASLARDVLDLRPRGGHFPASARAVILLLQNGGPSQVDLFDPKPELARRDGQSHSETLEILQPGNSNRLMASPFKFSQHGQCGMTFSNLLPHMASVADVAKFARWRYQQ